MGVLELHEFRLLFFSQTISVLADQMVGIALAFAVLDLGGGATEVGIDGVPDTATGGDAADRRRGRGPLLEADREGPLRACSPASRGCGRSSSSRGWGT